MTTASATETAVELLPSILDGLHKIGALSQVHADSAKTALVGIAAIYQTLRAGLRGELTPEVVKEAIAGLTKSVHDNNAKADEALSKKFDHGGES